MDKTIYITFKLVVKDSANADDLSDDCEGIINNFDHKDIVYTEWVETEEKSQIFQGKKKELPLENR